MVLMLMATKWLRCRRKVYIVSTEWWSHAACIMLYNLLLHSQVGVRQPGQIDLLLYEFADNMADVKKAVNELSQAAEDGLLYVIADEAAGSFSRYFKIFCKRLLKNVPRLRLWTTSCYENVAPAGWQLKYLTRPLRFPTAIVGEIQQDEAMTKWYDVKPYSKHGESNHTDGPPVKQLYHRGQGHSGDGPHDCVMCGREVASVLHSLRLGVSMKTAAASMTVTTISGSTTPPFLQWRDVLVLSLYDLSDESGLVTGLREADIPVRVMEVDDTEDVATARSDVVWVADGLRVRGLERKVVVCLDVNNWNKTRLFLMSRCTSQLVIVSPEIFV